MKKKYVTFTVRAAYQPKDDTIHLTSKDLDGPWHLTLNKHSEAEQTLRRELVAADLIAENQVGIPTPAPYPVDNQLPWHQFPLGATRGNQPVIWDVLKNTHALIAGATGSGKSILNQSLLLHAAQHPNWQVVGIDLKRVELARYRGVPALEDRIHIAIDLETSVALLRQIHDTMLERFKLLEEAEQTHFSALKDKQGNTPRPILLLIDEAFMLFAMEGAKTSEGKQRDAWHGEALELVQSIGLLGRAAGIYIALATQRPDTTVIPGAVRALFDMRIAVGRLNKTGSAIMLDSQDATDIPTIKGRGLVLSAGNKPIETQFYWSASTAINEIPTHLK